MIKSEAGWDGVSCPPRGLLGADEALLFYLGAVTQEFILVIHLISHVLGSFLEVPSRKYSIIVTILHINKKSKTPR